MSNLAILAAAAVSAAAISFAGASSAEARKHRNYGGVSVVIGAPVVYGGYRHHRHYRHRRYDYSPAYYYRGFEPACMRWGWVQSRSGKAKWRCVAW